MRDKRLYLAIGVTGVMLLGVVVGFFSIISMVANWGDDRLFWQSVCGGDMACVGVLLGVYILQRLMA